MEITALIWHKMIKNNKKYNNGFTLIEMIASIFIIALISGLFLANYHGANKRTALTMEVQKVASDIRLVQGYSLGSKEFSGAIPAGGWGIYFTEGALSYIIFADVDGGKDYDVEEKVETIDLAEGVAINAVSLGISASVVFLPPDPTVYLNGSSSGNVEIELSDGETVKSIEVNSLGLVDVMNNEVGGSATINIPPTPILPSGLIGHWTLDTQDIDWGTNKTNDSSGNSNTGILKNMSISANPTQGIIGQALNFNGTNNYIDCGQVPNYSFERNKPFSITGWVTIDGFTSSHAIVSKRDETADYKGFVFYYNLDPTAWNYGLVFQLRATNYNQILKVANGASLFSDVIFTSAPIFFAVTYNGNNVVSGINLYKNGILITDTKNQEANTLNQTTVNNSSLKIGVSGKTSLSIFQKGKIDDVRIYDHVLSASEIAELNTQGAERIADLTKDLVGYWTLDTQDINWGTNTIMDRSGLGNNGTITNMSQTTSPVLGVVNQALSFDGINDYINLGNDPDFDFEWNSPFSVSAWVYEPTTVAPSLDYGGIVGKFDGNTDKGWWLAANDFNNTFAFTLRHADTVSGNVYITIPAVHDRWAHLTIIYNGSGKKEGLSIYLDGVLQSPTRSGGPLGAYFSTIRNTNSAAIGTWVAGYDLAKIDDVRIYKRMLSATEVTQLYNLGGQ